MDAPAGEKAVVQYQNLIEPTITFPVQPQKCHSIGNAVHGEFLLSFSPSILVHVLSASNLDPWDLARLEVTCSFFRQHAGLHPDFELSLPELAALAMCQTRAIFRSMSEDQKQEFKNICGGSWKLVLRFLLAGEYSTRREKAQAVAGPGHSVVVTASGSVYSFGANDQGQLGHGTTDPELKPRLIRSLLGTRIIQASVGPGQTMLVSDTGKVYAFGENCFWDSKHPENELVTTPRLLESLSGTFVVQASVGHQFTAVLSREGKVYTFFWGDEDKLCHDCDVNDLMPRLLRGPLENLPVAQISAGHCYLLSLVCQPTGGMSVYSVGCGAGGKLGNGKDKKEKQPILIKEFQSLGLEPVAIAAGDWHAAVVGRDGRVCTWGWGNHGCLGHGNQDFQMTPKVVETLSGIRAVHVAAGEYTTFVVSENGDLYSFGSAFSFSLGNMNENCRGPVLIPELVTRIKEAGERIIHVSSSKFSTPHAREGHTFAMAQSGKLYAFGNGVFKLGDNQTKMSKTEMLTIEL